MQTSLIDDLAMFPAKIQVLHLYKDGEPLANKSLADMIEYAKKSSFIDRIETTTNGLLLTEKKSKDLIDAGLDGIRISIYGLGDRKYKEITRTAVNFEKIKKNVAGLFLYKLKHRPSFHVHCKIVNVGFTLEEQELFVSTFSPISDSIHIDQIMGWSNSSARDFTLGLAPKLGMTGETRVQSRIVCSEPFMKLVINHDGSVSVCCVDWSHETVIGNAHTTSLYDIWNGDSLKEFRLRHLNGLKSTLSACKSCDYIFGLPHHSNIDNLIDDLLPIYLGS